MLNIFYKLILKALTVKPFKRKLAVFNKYYFFHYIFRFFILFYWVGFNKFIKRRSKQVNILFRIKS